MARTITFAVMDVEYAGRQEGGIISPILSTGQDLNKDTTAFVLVIMENLKIHMSGHHMTKISSVWSLTRKYTRLHVSLYYFIKTLIIIFWKYRVAGSKYAGFMLKEFHREILS